MSEHWPRGTLVTRLYEGDSFALSLIRLSGETRAHRSPSARPAFLTVRRLLYSNDSFHSFSSAEFCSAYLTPLQETIPSPIPALVMAMRQDAMRRERVPDDVWLRVAVWMDRQPEAVPTSSFVTISRAR